MSARNHTLLYDADCGFCRWSLGVLLRSRRLADVRLVPLQSEEAAELLPGLTPQERMAAAHLVTGDGARYSGGDAAIELLRLPRVLRPAIALGYRLVAANRGVISKAVPKRAKRRADERIARRRSL